MKTLLCAALMTLALGACSSTSKQASPGIMNDTCPYSGNAASTNHTADYKGGKVGFCCDGCAGRFNKLDEPAKDALMSKAK
jgi:hypothetical protein